MLLNEKKKVLSEKALTCCVVFSCDGHCYTHCFLLNENDSAAMSESLDHL